MHLLRSNNSPGFSSLLQVIHRDLKLENILLKGVRMWEGGLEFFLFHFCGCTDFQPTSLMHLSAGTDPVTLSPKIADFGLSALVIRDLDDVVSRRQQQDGPSVVSGRQYQQEGPGMVSGRHMVSEGPPLPPSDSASAVPLTPPYDPRRTATPGELRLSLDEMATKTSTSSPPGDSLPRGEVETGRSTGGAAAASSSTTHTPRARKERRNSTLMAEAWTDNARRRVSQPSGFCQGAWG